MNRKSLYSGLMFILILWPMCSFSACPDPNIIKTVPKLVNVELKASVTLDPKTGIYNYSYSINNDSKSTGCIWHFELEIRKPQGGVNLSMDGLVNSNYVYLSDSNESGSPMIPVAFPSLPEKNRRIIWSAGFSVEGLASWGSNRYTYQIEPGDFLAGFVMVTYGLPAIRTFRVEPKYIAEDEDVYKMGVSKEAYYADAYKYLKAFYDSISWKGKTIGPTAPPADFQPTAFLDYIVSLKHEAYKLGWIVQGRDDGKERKKEDRVKKEDEEKGIMKSLDEKLSRARERLEKGDKKEAIEKLKSFVHEVEALYREDKDEEEKNERKNTKDKKALKGNEEHHERITSEAYALLKYNAQYLMDQITEKKKEHKE